MAAPTPLSRLDAVNLILAQIGESPVSSLAAPYSDDVATAIAALNEVDLETQSRGWNFNKDQCVVLVLDGDSKYVIPSNVVRVTVERRSWDTGEFAMRADPADDLLKLYNKRTQSFVLTAGLKAEVIYLFDFEKTPPVYRRYVAMRAGRIFQDRSQGQAALHAYTKEDEILAMKNLRQHEGAVDTRTIFDSYAAYRVIDRHYPNTSGTGDYP